MSLIGEFPFSKSNEQNSLLRWSSERFCFYIFNERSFHCLHIIMIKVSSLRCLYKHRVIVIHNLSEHRKDLS